MNKIQFQNIIIITFIYRHVRTLHSFLSANHRSITNIPFIPPDSKEIRHFQLVYHVCASLYLDAGAWNAGSLPLLIVGAVGAMLTCIAALVPGKKDKSETVAA